MWMTRPISVVLATVAFALTGCAPDYCARLEACATTVQAGQQACRDNQTARNAASSKSCTTQYDALTDCLTTLTCTQLDAQDSDTINAKCGGEVSAYVACMQ
jgi:hypothetical protein